MAQDVAVMDIGSGKITVLIGERGVNNTICVHGMGECTYAGFTDGSFIQPSELGRAVNKAIAAAQTTSGRKISELYIGVPGEFTATKCKEVSISFGRKRRITENDVDELFERGNTYASNNDSVLINNQPIFYLLDDDYKVSHPEGSMSSVLKGIISYTLAEKSFVEIFKQIFDGSEIEIDFVSSLLAEALYLFNDTLRDKFAVMIDVGYLVTYVAVVRGDGILKQFSIPLGGGHITNSLKDYLGIKFSAAEKLKRKVNLSLEVDDSETYTITNKDRVTAYGAKRVNEVVTAKLTTLSKVIRRCLAECEYPESIPYHLTGGGISYIKGASAYLSKKLQRDVIQASPMLPQYAKPHLSSLFGLMDMVLGEDEPESKGLFAKLLGR